MGTQVTKQEMLESIFNEANELETTFKYCLNEYERDIEDINKLDLFWLEQLQINVSNLIHRTKIFNKMDDD